MTLTPEPLQIDAEIELSSEDLVRLAGDAYRFSLSRPRQWLTLAFVVLFLVGIAVLAGTVLDLSIWVVVLAALGGLGSVAGSMRREYNRQVARQRRVGGGNYGLGFGENALHWRTPLASGQIPYVEYDSVAVRPRFVALRVRDSQHYSLWPARLFTDGDVVRFRAAIANR